MVVSGMLLITVAIGVIVAAYLGSVLNSDSNAITYATPIYKDGVFVGVIGMEIDFAYITAMVQTITVYDNGFAYISTLWRTETRLPE